MAYGYCKRLIKKAAGFLKNACQYSIVAMAGVALSAAMTVTIARLDGNGSTALTAHAETKGQEEGRLLAGEAMAEGIFDMRQLRRQRQEDIEQTKEMIQKKKEEQAEASVAAGNQTQEQEKSPVMLAGQEAAKEKTAKDAMEGGQAETDAEVEAEGIRPASSVISYSQNDYEVLKRIVEAEAGVCDIKGRILVANVVINRVRDREFPDTITGVVYQKSQFSPVSNGSLNSCTVTPETVEAVDRALAGEDYSQGALYFMNRVRSQSGNVSWFDKSLTYLFQHERHEFFK